MKYKASEDPRRKASESFYNLLYELAGEEVFVELPGREAAIRVPNDKEQEAFFFRGPDAFQDSARFEEVRAYMRHYWRDADHVEKFWAQNKKIEAEIAQATEEKVYRGG